MLADGADIIDVGGESTRPGAEGISAQDEIARVVPVIAAIARQWPDTLISVDTVKSEVAEAAADAGAAIINDVSGLRIDERIADIARARELGLVLMHSRGSVAEMGRYESGVYGPDVVAEIVEDLRASAACAQEHRVAVEQIVVDPGLGFSKRTAQSVAVLAELERVLALGYPVLIGPSRKRFVGELLGGLPVEDRLEGTLGALVAGLARGAAIFRVHDVAAARHALDVADAILNP
jgi:dihydropteroate synthase